MATKKMGLNPAAPRPKTKSSKILTMTTHKDRAQWYFSRSTFPLRDAPPTALERFWDHLGDYQQVPGVEWEESGPRNVPGRVTCLLLDPQDPQKMYAGAAAGGVWTTDNGGELWKPCWPRLLTQNIGALAIDPQDGRSLVCATGEGNLSSDSYPGGGVFSSSNSGFSWRPLFTAPDGLPLDEAARALLPRRIGTIAFGFPSESNGAPRIALGAVSDSEIIPAALYLDSGGFGLQPITFWGDRNYNCYAVVFHPIHKDWICASIQPGGTQSGIWRSKDFGKSWEHLTKGLPPGEMCGRIGLAMAPSDPNVLYALVTKTVTHNVLGVFRSSNGGDSWKEVGGGHFARESQLSYNNCVAVHPTKPDFVVCGATELHLSENGGRLWKQVTTGDPGNGVQPVRKYCHNDHHAVIITPDGVIYSGNDGGIARSTNSGRSWKTSSEGMVTAMFYAADVAPSNSRIYGGGTQDNGTLIAGVPARKDQPPPADPFHFVHVIDGDGGWIKFDPADAEHVFGSTSDFTVFLHKRGQPWAKGDQLAFWQEIPVKSKFLTPVEKGQRAIFVMEIDRSTRKGPKSVYLGTSRLWRTKNDGRKWEPISPFFDGTAISAIACDLDRKHIFVGTSRGGLYRTRDGGNTWSADLAGAAIPSRLITRIAFHPVDRKTIVITVGSTGIPGVNLVRTDVSVGNNNQSAAQPYGHVFRSVDGGETWHALDSGQLPDVVYNALTFETHPPYRIFAGGDAGVWVTTINTAYKEATDCGWASFGGNMPNVVVSDLNFNHKDRILTAATYGRGIWRHKAHEPLEAVAPIPVSADADPGPSAVGWLLDPSKATPELISPVDGSVFDHFPRRTELTWKPVEGAIGYSVALNLNGGALPGIEAAETQVTFDFVGAQSGIWQVWALFPDDRRSPGSAKRTFRYTR